MIAKIKCWFLHRALDRMTSDLISATSREHKLIIARDIERVIVRLRNLRGNV